MMLHFFAYIRKFLPERCVPDFKLSRKDYSVTNSMLWASVVFLLSDGYCCQRDIFRYASMRVRDAEKILW